jgi:hypothetical protein
MKLFNKLFPVLLAGAVLVSSCKKDKEFEPIGDAGRTIVKMLNGGSTDEPSTSLTGVNFASGDQTIVVGEIRRDVPNEAELNQSVTVTVKVDTTMMRIVNDTLAAHGLQTYSTMPDAWYTSSPDFTWGGTFEVTFAPGEFAKAISITIPNATLMDPSSIYGFPFTIVSTNPEKYVSHFQSTISLVGAKNDYDGIYELTWTNYHPTSNPGYTGGTTTVHMITTGATKVKIFWPDAGTYANPAILGGGLSYFGAQEPEYTFDPVTNKVTVQNAYNGAVTFYSMAPGFDSHYDPATKEIFAKWGYSSGGTYPPFNPANAREWTQHFTYVGPR